MMTHRNMSVGRSRHSHSIAISTDTMVRKRLLHKKGHGLTTESPTFPKAPEPSCLMTTKLVDGSRGTKSRALRPGLGRAKAEAATAFG